MATEEIDEVEVEWGQKKSKLPIILGALTVFVLGGGAGLAGTSTAHQLQGGVATSSFFLLPAEA